MSKGQYCLHNKKLNGFLTFCPRYTVLYISAGCLQCKYAPTLLLKLFLSANRPYA